MQIAFYGHLGEAIGREITFDRQEARTVGDLRAALARAYPGHAEELTGERLKALIGDEFVPDRTTLEDTARIEFLPPVSGG